ncbi:MAG: hypothetical protein LQ349_001689 [Xanthoria aureola]|nr:MAG: hypothetical protein LQ349_001689 [Xanthoria aureola]
MWGLQSSLDTPIQQNIEIAHFEKPQYCWSVSGMSDEANDEVTSIAVKFSDCLGSYRQLYFWLTNRHIQGLQDIDLTEVSDNYGRLKVWGADSGALRTGRGSLDDILRTDKNLRSILLDLLGDLLEAIGRARLAFQETEDVSTNNNLTAHDDHQDSESNTSTASEQSGDGESGTRPEENNAQLLISIIFAYIRSLYKLSKSLRRFTVHGDYSLTVSKYADASNFASSDQKHIENRFPRALKFLVLRLGLANTRRRQQLQYWEKHHAIPSQDFLSSSWARNSEIIAQEVGALKSTTWASESGQVPAPSLRTPSRASHDSFTAIARSDLQDDTSLPEGRDTGYAPSLPEENRSFRIPDIPNIPADQASFECSYCHAQLDAVTMTQRGVWK